MTVTTTNRKSTPYTGTGANTALPTTFPFVANSDVEVISRVTATGVETTLVEGTNYTLTGGDYATGTVTPIAGATDFPSTVTWTIQRVTSRTQETDYVEGDPFPAESHERALDKLTYLQQESSEDADRALKIPVGESGTTTEIPNVVDRASKYGGYDASGNPVALDAPAGTTAVSSFWAPILLHTLASQSRATLVSQEDVISARGDIIRGDASGDAEFYSLGVAGTALISDGTDPVWGEVAFPQGHIWGLTLSNDIGDTPNDIAIAAGKCRDQGDAANIVRSAKLTKQIDAPWVAGDDAGGYPSGLGALATGWYHVFLIRNPTTEVVDGGFDTSLTAANLLADATGYTQYRRVGSIKYDTATIVQFKQLFDHFLWDAVPNLTAYVATTAVTHPCDLPPGVSVLAKVSIDMEVNAGSTNARYVDGIISDTRTSSATLADVGYPGANATGVFTGEMVSDASGNIRLYRATNSDFAVSEHGWVDFRGRLG